MATCKVCDKAIDMFNVDLGKGVKVHVGCFFNESIPNSPSKTDVNFKELNFKRKVAIDNRVIEILGNK